jgi:hypothetical protein
MFKHMMASDNSVDNESCFGECSNDTLTGDGR